MPKKAGVFFAVFVLASTVAFGQLSQTQQRNRTNDGSIRGKVIIPNQRDSDQRMEVRLETSALQALQIAYTDASGNFDFRNLSPGGYYVSINLDGYEPVHQLVEIFSGFGSTSVTIMMSKPAFEIRERPSGLDAADPDIVDVSQMKENFPKKAIQDYEKALDERKKGHLENAVKLLEEAIQVAPKFFHAHNNLGIIYQALKRYTDAEREFKSSRQLNNKTERPLVNLGSLYIEESNLQKTDEATRGKLLDEALDSLEEAVKLNSHSAVGYFLLGQANYKSDFLEEAEVAFKKAHDLDPRLSAAQLMLANVYVRQQKWDDVIEHLDAYLKENPKASDRASVEEMRARISKSIEAKNEPAVHPQ